MKIRTLIAAGLLWSMPALAKPVSYVGGTMLMQENDEGGYTVGVDHTVLPWMAVALHAQRHTFASAFTMAGPQVNFLVRRWNMPDGQANIFANIGGGAAFEGAGTKIAGWTGLLADYETRRVFTSYEIRFMVADKIMRETWQRGRVGFAPYLGTYDEINPWLMVQVDRRDEKHFSAHAHGILPPPTDVTPLIRIVYKTFLVEGGVSVRGKVMFNWVQQF